MFPPFVCLHVHHLISELIKALTKPCSMSCGCHGYAALKCTSHMINATQHSTRPFRGYDCKKHCPKKQCDVQCCREEFGVKWAFCVYPVISWWCLWERNWGGGEREKIAQLENTLTMQFKIRKPVLLGKPACHYSGKVGNSLSIVCQEQNACNPAQIVFWDIMHYLCTVPWQAPSRIWPDWHLRSPFV